MSVKPTIEHCIITQLRIDDLFYDLYFAVTVTLSPMIQEMLIFFCICMTYSGAVKVQYVSAACIKLFQSIVAVVNYITITFVTYCIAWNDKYIR